jgi:hypothetical protein
LRRPALGVVADIGGGHGAWTIVMAEAYSRSEFVD